MPTKSKIKIKFTPQFKEAFESMEQTKQNIFLTGKAGTGKSTLLNYFRDHTGKKIVVLAPTGVAAINVKGQTIHSFFGFKPNITLNKVGRKYRQDDPKNIYSKLDAIVIDEISMVRADLLDCIDKFMRLNGREDKLPFGGIQMIFIGDLYQLPPVVTGEEKILFKTEYGSPYFFSAKVFADFRIKLIELEKIYRQNDSDFIKLLNSIRNNSIQEEGLKKLNQKLNPEFKSREEDFYVYLTTTNAMAENFNREKLSEKKGKEYFLKGDVIGNFDTKYMPTEPNLTLKEEAQVMLLNNDLMGRWVNGSIGKIISINKDDEIITVKLNEGKKVKVKPHTWEIFNFAYDPKKKRIKSKIVGSFIQYPLKLAWAITIHKSQGKTFDKVIIDIGNGTFSHGQIYVALSRCTTFEGLILKKPIEKKHILMDYRVVNFITNYRYGLAEEGFPLEKKIELIKQAIVDGFNLDVTYLRANDTKSKRKLKPKIVGEMEYLGKKYIGLKAFCLLRQEERTFRVDRMLELRIDD